MAEFNTKVKGNILENEGSYSNNVYDRGGETIGGITIKYFPAEFKEAYNLYVNNKLTEYLDYLYKFYKKNFWDMLSCDDIKDQHTAEHLFDIAINSGIQRALELATDTFEEHKVAVLTNKKMVIKYINQLSEAHLVSWNNTLVDLRIKFYKDIVRRRPSQITFLKGWIKRANRFRIEVKND